MKLQYQDCICDSLKCIILEKLKNKVQPKCIYLDLPYHSNVGDSLIWLGTEEFLKEIGSTCIGKHSKDTFDFKEIPQDCTIILHGGGNFGDIWREHQEFRNKVCQTYPQNNIIVLPQTIYYESNELLANDIGIFNNHRKLSICARDQYSYDLLVHNGYVGDILLVPDMAFCINRKSLMVMAKRCNKELLLLTRNDKEFPSLDTKITTADFRDWSGMQENGDIAWEYTHTHAPEEVDDFFQNSFLRELIKEGVEFVSEYKEVYSTRLHVVILRLLLGLDVYLLDNSYGKNSHFVDTWLKDSSQIKHIDTQQEKEILIAMHYNQRIKTISLDRDNLRRTNDFVKQQVSETMEQLSLVKRSNDGLTKEVAELADRIKYITRKNQKLGNILKYSVIAYTIVLIILLIFILK